MRVIAKPGGGRKLPIYLGAQHSFQIRLLHSLLPVAQKRPFRERRSFFPTSGGEARISEWLAVPDHAAESDMRVRLPVKEKFKLKPPRDEGGRSTFANHN